MKNFGAVFLQTMVDGRAHSVIMVGAGHFYGWVDLGVFLRPPCGRENDPSAFFEIRPRGFAVSRMINTILSYSFGPFTMATIFPHTKSYPGFNSNFSKRLFPSPRGVSSSIRRGAVRAHRGKWGWKERTRRRWHAWSTPGVSHQEHATRIVRTE